MKRAPADSNKSCGWVKIHLCLSGQAGPRMLTTWVLSFGRTLEMRRVRVDFLHGYAVPGLSSKDLTKS